jgi:hypothetical protein
MDIDLKDTCHIDDRKEEIYDRQKAHVEQIVSSALFQKWIVLTNSAKLLVQWDTDRSDSTAGTSPLTIFCTTMAQVLRARDRFISVLWFCGHHYDRSDGGNCVGGYAMLASLVDQILRQHAFYTEGLHHEINFNLLKGGQFLEELLRLLGWLMRQLPRALTVFFILDGVYLFEREDFWLDAQSVFLGILRLVNDTSVSATVKVLFTSSPRTTTVRGAFEEEGLILDVDELPKLGWASSDERIIREMDGY